MLSVHVDYRETVKQLKGIAYDQMPFALASALTKTAQAAQRRVQSKTKKAFKLSTDFIPKGIRITPASKSQIRMTGVASAHVYTAPIISNWMPQHETGEDKKSERGRKISIPQEALLKQNAKTARGGIKASKKPKALIERAKRASENIHKQRKGRIPSAPFLLKLKKTGDHVIFQRFGKSKGAIEPLYRFASVADIKPAWEFHDAVRIVADKAFPRYFQLELDRALASAKLR